MSIIAVCAICGHIVHEAIKHLGLFVNKSVSNFFVNMMNALIGLHDETGNRASTSRSINGLASHCLYPVPQPCR